LTVLAHAGALRSLAKGNRRNAIWTAAAAVPDKDILRGTERDDEAQARPQASEGSEIVTDYRAMGFTLGRHPLELLRDRLRADRLLPARELAQLRNGQFARACGIVTVRQRPGTAKGVLFITLEDETGQTNVIVWPDLVEKYRREALGASLLAVYGVWQAESGVYHLVAEELRDRTELLGGLTVESHDSH
uniref:OB-fold nucleic acid binding domain-containing protein n=1 Tax=Burkholderia gladioli TaxID=28095 RepID=UPI002FE21ABA